MSQVLPRSEPRPRDARAAVVACQTCGRPLIGGQKTACSGLCRAKLSRQRRAETEAERDQRVRALLAEALRLLDGGSTP